MRDEAIIVGIRRGDPGAINAAMDQYSRLLWSTARSVLGAGATEQDAEECIADVFITLWQQPEKFDPSRGTLKAWLVVMTRSRCADRCRQLLRKSALPLEEYVPALEGDPASALEQQERRETLARAVEQLPQPEREILRRRYGENQMPRQIALEMAMPVKQVENRLYRAKQKLRRRLEDTE